jgi:hypothetical protein
MNDASAGSPSGAGDVKNGSARLASEPVAAAA